MATLEPIIFSGTSHPNLAREVAREAGVTFGNARIESFPDGEISVEVLDPARDREVFVFQSVGRRPNYFLMELCLLLDALKRASAARITAVIPYFGYARQDRRGDIRAPITAKLVADLLQTAGADHLLTVDLHAEQIQGFFDIPVDNLHASSILIDGIAALGLEGAVVVAPDLGSVKIARTFAHRLGMDFAVVDKERVGEEALARTIIGDVSGREVVIVDDMCTTGSTLIAAANRLKQAGATTIRSAVSHGLFVEGAVEKIEQSPIETVLVADTLADIPVHQKIKTLSVAPLLSEAVGRLIEAKSLSTLLT